MLVEDESRGEAQATARGCDRFRPCRLVLAEEWFGY
jgi:hypothetical protein